jgi:hypothetical protein
MERGTLYGITFYYFIYLTQGVKLRASHLLSRCFSRSANPTPSYILIGCRLLFLNYSSIKLILKTKSGQVQYNPSYSGGGDREDCGLKPIWAKSLSHLNQWLDTVALTCHPGNRENTNRRIAVLAGSSIKQDAISKITSTKRAGGITQVVEHLPSKAKFNP